MTNSLIRTDYVTANLHAKHFMFDLVLRFLRLNSELLLVPLRDFCRTKSGTGEFGKLESTPLEFGIFGQ